MMRKFGSFNYFKEISKVESAICRLCSYCCTDQCAIWVNNSDTPGEHKLINDPYGLCEKYKHFKFNVNKQKG